MLVNFIHQSHSTLNNSNAWSVASHFTCTVSLSFTVYMSNVLLTLQLLCFLAVRALLNSTELYCNISINRPYSATGALRRPMWNMSEIKLTLWEAKRNLIDLLID